VEHQVVLPGARALPKVEMEAVLVVVAEDILKAVLVVVSKVEIMVDFPERMGVILYQLVGRHHLQVMVEQMESVE
jgi:hypothetical protein